MIDVKAFGNDDKAFARRLLESQKMSVLPGSAFGESTAGHVRYSLVQPMDILMEGCDRLEAFAVGG